jgi:hypothetical protein
MRSKRFQAVAFLLVPLMFATPCFSRSHRLKGRIFAYDPLLLENNEDFVLELSSKGQERQYVLLNVSKSEYSRIPKNYFRGDAVLDLRAIRDPSCDSASINLVMSMSDLEDNEHARMNSDGTEGVVPLKQGYIVSEHFKSQALPHLAHLKCYSSNSLDK